ncbi:hypothetical protein MXB_4956 [Myxobolus squamalis]|nr:hypothetical protein MXB_4956 [Myxobolus squamalis]
MQMSERKYILESIKWVDEVVVNVPYITDPKTLDYHKCAFCIHGSDDVFSIDGTDCYELVKKTERYKSCPRTRCIASTDIIQRQYHIQPIYILPILRTVSN